MAIAPLAIEVENPDTTYTWTDFAVDYAEYVVLAEGTPGWVSYDNGDVTSLFGDQDTIDCDGTAGSQCFSWCDPGTECDEKAT